MSVHNELPVGQGGRAIAGESYRLANYAFARMKGLFPDRLTLKLSSMELIRMFVSTLADEMHRRGITREMVEVGMHRIAIECEWPPVDVPVFLRYCLPVRDYRAAFAEAQEKAYLRNVGFGGGPKDWSHPAVYWAASRFGWFELRNGSWDRVSGRWAAILDAVLSWGAWPEIEPLAIPEKTKLQTRRVQMDALAAMREKLAAAIVGGAAAEGYERRTVVESDV
ncbi:hypothetical protein [Chromobacterium subtsugae]|uniref:hypothetical protein n=1 Tax=Chromobacterium subtsugae TaxID=251747 RepID=UPI000AD3A655|nr:hypothetical protein [Chromobacterium subtsugae]